MGRLIDVDEVKKRYPIMENDFGMVINESLHKELDKIPTVEAISKAKLDKIRGEIEEYKSKQLTLAIGVEDLEKGKQIALEYVLAILDKYKAESEEVANDE